MFVQNRVFKKTYKVLSHWVSGQPSNLRPWATVALSLQQPNLVSSQVKYWGQSWSKGPLAALTPSGQQPKVELAHGSSGSGLHLWDPKMVWSSSLVGGSVTENTGCFIEEFRAWSTNNENGS